MNKLAILFAFLFLSGVTGCQTLSRDSSPPPTPAQISKALKKLCDRLGNIPDRDLSRDDLIRLIAQERKSHGACIRKDDKLVKAAEALEKQGQKP
ncbi:hypothetical protein [Mesorhizobium sp. Root172]|uniref:hypothetical protein n=1 Tax=Mesorhizobium sp. Root172 TaxID=1736481 RepID=UPI0006F606EC|nr:hypothetical protein [Mesorhizobium sp. Root172]KRB22663.1 hypothetical protein ASE05_15880 [Mesorhizobium sp. Root172]